MRVRTDAKFGGKVTTKDLEVTGNAHFFNLVVDEVKAAGGQVILSAADMTIDKVEQARHYTPDFDARVLDYLHVPYEQAGDDRIYAPATIECYRLLRKRKENERTTDLHWQQGDLCIFWQFDVDVQGAVNPYGYFWKPVIWKGTTTDAELGECEYIDLPIEIFL